jgi:lipoyl(octanoyl) transferase
VNAASVPRVRRLGTVDYADALTAMQAFTAQRDDATADELWLLQHPPVFTQGVAGKAEHLLQPGDIPVLPVDRGGQVTYHGPGQWVVYLLLDLKRRRMGVRALVDLIERTLVTTLAGYGIEAAADPAAPGVYVAGAKIASLGLRVRRGCSYHGLALNVAMDLEPFRRINPCGYPGLAVTSLEEQLGAACPGLEEVGECLLATLLAELADPARPPRR